jgi:hypothetical protein
VTVEDAWAEMHKYEVIAENTLRKYGRVSDELAEKLQLAQINHAVAKDNRSDPYMTPANICLNADRVAQIWE